MQNVRYHENDPRRVSFSLVKPADYLTKMVMQNL